jgi:hypothetical protein
MHTRTPSRLKPVTVGVAGMHDALPYLLWLEAGSRSFQPRAQHIALPRVQARAQAKAQAQAILYDVRDSGVGEFGSWVSTPPWVMSGGGGSQQPTGPLECGVRSAAGRPVLQPPVPSGGFGF